MSTDNLPTDHTRSDSQGVDIESLVEALVESERTPERVTEVVGMLNSALNDLDGLQTWHIVAMWSEHTFVGLALLDTSEAAPPHTCYDPSDMLTRFLLEPWGWENDPNGYLARDRQEIAAALSVDYNEWVGNANLTTSRLWRSYCEQANQTTLPPGLTDVVVTPDITSVWPPSAPHGRESITSQLDELIYRVTSREFPESGVAALLQLNSLQTLLSKSGANTPPAISAAVQPQIDALIETVVADLPSRPWPSADGVADLDPLPDTSAAGDLLRGEPDIGHTHPIPVLNRLIRQLESMIPSSVYDDDDEVMPTPSDAQAHTMTDHPATVPAVHRRMSGLAGPLNIAIKQLERMQTALLELGKINPDLATGVATSSLHVQSVMDIDRQVAALYGRGVADSLIDPIERVTRHFAHGDDTPTTTPIRLWAPSQVRDDLQQQAKTYAQTTLSTLKEWRDTPPNTVSGLDPAIRQAPATDPVLSGRQAATPPTTTQKGQHR